MSDRINVDQPLWDQSTFAGRFKHFLWVTDPRMCFINNQDLDAAKALVEQYRRGAEPSGTTRDQVVRAMKLYGGAFHPDTGDRQNLFGRMSFQLPANMILTGCMMQWYRTNLAVVSWQWINQSFNAVVNYTNRNAKTQTTPTQLAVAYVMATTCALVTALGCKYHWSRTATPLLQRYAPFVAVAAANGVNIPLMRQNEVIDGVDCTDGDGRPAGKSRLAAVKGISQVVTSRVAMCAPGMLLLPIVMERLEPTPWMQSVKALHGPMQVMAVACFLVFMVPAGCGLFPQRASVKLTTLKRLEPSAYDDMHKRYGAKNLPERVYFNKGL